MSNIKNLYENLSTSEMKTAATWDTEAKSIDTLSLANPSQSTKVSEQMMCLLDKLVKMDILTENIRRIINDPMPVDGLDEKGPEPHCIAENVEINLWYANRILERLHQIMDAL